MFLNFKQSQCALHQELYAIIIHILFKPISCPVDLGLSDLKWDYKFNSFTKLTQILVSDHESTTRFMRYLFNLKPIFEGLYINVTITLTLLKMKLDPIIKSKGKSVKNTNTANGGIIKQFLVALRSVSCYCELNLRKRYSQEPC